MDIKRVSRRSFWIALLSATVYLLYRIAAHNNWIIVTRGWRPYDRGVAPVSARPDEEISLLVVGDTGLPSEQRAEVVAAMQKQSADGSVDGVVMVGDNFYEKGVNSVSDSRFESDFERLFDPQHFDCPFYVVLGNHDHKGNVQAQIDYTDRSDRWRMPGRHYKARQQSETTTVDLFMIDTDPIHEGEPGADAQLQWLDRELSRSDATWKIVVGHHPCLSGGEHGRSELVSQHLAPLLTKHRVSLYLSGHDHDLQLLDSGEGWHQVVSGSGSKLRSTSWTGETKFASAAPGFTWLLIREHHLTVTFFGSDKRLYSHQIPASFIPIQTATHDDRRAPGHLDDLTILTKC